MFVVVVFFYIDTQSHKFIKVVGFVFWVYIQLFNLCGAISTSPKSTSDRHK